ncbi:DNA-directed RNA polymerase subunit beta, partial [Candidatus Woesebacteria bacterium]|nr:DNA-directed RNA polymerase subunit beta [Candidatus Woesebacteria bacterium]
MQTPRQYWGKQDIKLPKLDLTRVQRESYEWFLKEGIQEALNEINAGNGIEDFTRKNWKLEFGEFSLGNPKISPATARRKALTYDMPLRVMATLTNKQTGQQTRQEVFLGDIPKMTQTGTFIINGVERAVVNQLVRAPGIFYSADIDPNTGRSLYHAELRPLRGSWLELSVGRGDVITVKIDKHRKIAVTTLLRALGYAANDDIVGMFSDTDKNPDHQYIQATLAKDTTATTAEALLEIYEKMRPGEPAVLENATELLNELFFDPRRYDLGKVGRYKMNRRLKVNIPNEKENHVLTK